MLWMMLRLMRVMLWLMIGHRVELIARTAGFAVGLTMDVLMIISVGYISVHFVARFEVDEFKLVLLGAFHFDLRILVGSKSFGILFRDFVAEKAALCDALQSGLHC